MKKPIRILYLEYVSSDAELVLRELSKAGFSYTHQIVESKKDYIDAFVSFMPDLILSDYHLPKFDGLDALRIRNKIAIQIPFVFVTNSTSEELAVQCMKTGANDYILKSNLKGLIPSIKSCLAKRSSTLLQKEKELLIDLEKKVKTGSERVSDCPIFLEMVSESVGMGTWTYDIANGKSFYSKNAYKLLGLEPDKIIITEKDVINRCHKDDTEKLTTFFLSILKAKRKSEVEFRSIHDDGTVKLLLLRSKTIYNKQKIPLITYGLVWDKTDQELLFLSHKESVRKTNSIINNLRGAVFRCKNDKALTVEYISKGILDLSGYPASDFIMNRVRSFVKLIHPEDKKRIIKLITQALKEKKSFTAEYRIISKDESVKWLWLRGKGVILGNTTIALEGFVTDITERKKAEDELRSSLVQMRQLTQYIERIREEERLSISRDLHDDLGQALTSIKIDLGIIKQKIADDEVVERVTDVTSLVRDAIKSVQRLTGQLRPPIIDDLGLEAAIEWYVKEFSNRTGIKVRFKIKSGTSISKEASLILFRIMQESLTNVVRHAKATQVDIRLVKTNGNIEFYISDNGVGIKEADLNSAKSFGIISMRERAASLGGTFKIYRDNNCCTIVKLIFPAKIKASHENFNL